MSGGPTLGRSRESIWGGGEMPYYLVQAAYTPEAWKAQVRSPQNVIDRIKPAVEAVGGRLDPNQFYYAFGEYDVVAVAEFPDNESAAAFSLGVAGGGAAKALKTTPLMTVKQGMNAMEKAQKVAGAYQPPKELTRA
jgi:uncharacterized protein with GYD domain